MQAQQHRHEQHNPGQIDQRNRPRSGQERMDRIKIADELQPVIAVGRLGLRPVQGGAVQAGKQIIMHRVGQAQQKFRADRLEQGLKQIDHGKHGKQCHQRRHTATGQHRIINQHHVGRARKDQQVDQHAGHRNHPQMAAIALHKQCQDMPIHAAKLAPLRGLVPAMANDLAQFAASSGEVGTEVMQ